MHKQPINIFQFLIGRISRLKFNRALHYAPLLASIFNRQLSQRSTNTPDCIIPVPLHPSRQRDRGFNQSLEIARLVSKMTGIPVEKSLCKRIRSTPFQSGLNAVTRNRNVKNAFQVVKKSHYRHVAIFDDVVTTGSTVNELARVLKKAGVEIIEVWAIARTHEKTS